MRDPLNAGVISEITRTLKTIRFIHSHIHANKADMRRMIVKILGDLVGLCLTGGDRTRPTA